MKVYYRPSPKLTMEFEVSDQKDFVEKLAEMQEVVSHKCGKCGSDDITCQVRTVDENKFYELKCSKCFAVLAFGAHKKGGTLFPKRYVEEEGERKWLPDNGWTKWDAEKKQRV